MSGRAPLRPRDAYRHWTPVATRWIDNDIYGHVNNAVYYHWFDTAVNGWLLAAGLLEIGGDGPIGLVAETGCRYAASVAYPDQVDIGLCVDRLGTSSVTYRLGVFRTGETAAAAEGHFTHVCVDRASRRPVPLPDRWRDVLAGLQGEGA